MMINRLGILLLQLSICFGQLLCPSEDCDSSVCQEPDCACSTSVPSNIALSDRPQIVYLSFDDAFTALSETNYYETLFDGTYTNPNGCAIRATHFVTHYSNDYSLNSKYYSMGHEFASQGITYRSNTTYWRSLSTEGWQDEIGGMKEMLGLYANIPAEQVVGMRAPYLQVGTDRQFQMLQPNGFLYDSSMPSLEYGFTNMANGIWPYTLEYASNLNCQIEPCPRCSYPGLWEQQILDLEDMWLGATGNPDVGVPCDMLDSCIIPTGTDPELVKEMMMKNFLRAYNGNTRAPIGFYMHASWFYSAEWHYQGYKLFLEEITTQSPYKDNTWIVPIKDGIAYRRNPVPNSELVADNFEPFKCDNYPVYDCNPQVCPFYNVENEDFVQSEIRMTVCGRCPRVYPWLGNPAGERP